MVQETEKPRSRAADLLAKMEEGFFRGPNRADSVRAGSQGQRMSRDQVIFLAAGSLANNPRDERAGMLIYNYCLKSGCSEDELEYVLLGVAHILHTQFGMPVPGVQKLLDELVKRVAAMGRFQFGKR